MKHNFDDNIIKSSLSSNDSIITESAKDKFENRIKGNREKVNRTVEFNNANKELTLQRGDRSEWAVELNTANKELALQNEENADQAAELVIANKELAFQNGEKANRAAELNIANKELAFQSGEKADRAAELVIANKELSFQIGEKADRAAELIIANKKIAFQIRERADRAAELIIANKELAYQSGEKADRAVELIIANKELASQIEENADQATALIIANRELTLQSAEKGDMAAELIIANKELAFQNEQKGKRAAELTIANNKLLIANKELTFQSEEKAKRSVELFIANNKLITYNKELALQSKENVDQAADLVIANKNLIISNEALALQSKENAERAAKLITANKEQGEYFVNISHELKTPLNVINSAAQLVLMYCDNGSFDKNKNSIIKYIDSTKQNCYRLSKLINNIVDLSKVEVGFLKLNLSNNNIVEVVEKMVTSVTSFTESKGISIIFDTNTEEKIIACDSEKIERIVLNLISNAIKFSSVGDEIFVQVKDRNKFVEISVKDNGIGIEKKNLEIIFNRFKQVDKSLSRNSEGTGIGLSLVKSFTELHGGSIHVESKVGKGSKFTIKLPSKNVRHENILYESNMNSRNKSVKVELSDVYL